MKNRRTSNEEAIKIYEVMRACVTKLENGWCEYTTGWDDERVAKNTGVPKYNVQYVRKQHFGLLKNCENATEGRHAGQRLAELELTIKGLETAIANLEGELSALRKWAQGRGYSSHGHVVHTFKELAK